MSNSLVRRHFPTFRRRWPIGLLRRRRAADRRADGWCRRVTRDRSWGRPGRRLGLPLLVKELTELAARRRTYVLRVVYALLLYALTGLVSWQYLAGRGDENPWGVLGAGHEILNNLVMLQFAGIYLFVPALMSGAIAAEKENASLVLLMLTDLRLRHILLQKFLGRLMPMFTFLLLALPLMGVIFALGGVTPGEVLAGVWLLMAACLQVGALCLLLSAFCHSTAAALVMSYPALLVLNFALPLCVSLASLFVGGGRELISKEAAACLVPVVLYIQLWDTPGAGSLLSAVWVSIPTLVSTAVLLVLARWAFVRRAMTTPRNVLMVFFRWLDAYWEQANWVTGGVVLARPRSLLPDDQPVAWREISTRGLGQPQYLFRILAVLETLVFLFIVAEVAGSPYDSPPGSRTPAALLLIIWPITFLLVVTQAAGAMSVERSKQTMEVLLTTPMTGRDIVLQKITSLRRLLMVLAVPLFSVLLVEAWWRAAHFDLAALGFTVLGALLIVVDLSALTWMCFWIGMRSRRQGRAVVVALLVTTAWCFLPVGVDLTVSMLRPVPAVLATNALPPAPEHHYQLFPIISPAGAIAINETGSYPAWNPAAAVGIHLALCLGVLAAFRGLCLRRADRYLGRV